MIPQEVLSPVGMRRAHWQLCSLVMCPGWPFPMGFRRKVSLFSISKGKRAFILGCLPGQLAPGLGRHLPLPTHTSEDPIPPRQGQAGPFLPQSGSGHSRLCSTRSPGQELPRGLLCLPPAGQALGGGCFQTQLFW